MFIAVTKDSVLTQINGVGRKTRQQQKDKMLLSHEERVELAAFHYTQVGNWLILNDCSKGNPVAFCLDKNRDISGGCCLTNKDVCNGMS